MSEPHFPPDLERRTFEIAFRADKRSNGLNLILTAKRAYTWLKPLLYESIAIDNADRLYQIVCTVDSELHDPQFFARTVREVSITRSYYTQFDLDEPRSMCRLLEACSNVTVLTTTFPDFVHDPLSEVISKMHLKHLYVLQFSELLLLGLQRSAKKSLHLPLFHSLTHLRIDDVPDAEELDCFYGLTHFAMGSNISGNSWSPPLQISPPVVRSLLQRTGQKHAVMEVVVICGQFGTFDPIKDPVSSDFRLVSIPPHNRPEFWEEAEEIVRERKIALRKDGAE